jgi:hypothetical protein
MNVPAASLFHLLKARVRLHCGQGASKIAIWPVVNPDEDGRQYGLEGIKAAVGRKTSLAAAEELAARKPALVFFVGPSPTRWPDLFDVVEILRQAGACSVLATAPDVFNAMSAPRIAYHFSRIYCVVARKASNEDLRNIRLLTSLHPRAAVEARIFGDPTGEKAQTLYAAGVCRVCNWPPKNSLECLVVEDDQIVLSNSPWCADHVWLKERRNLTMKQS